MPSLNKGGGAYTDAEAIAAVEAEATLALAGDVDVATGKTLSSDGLLFPDTQVASADANELDDYEEGTFTPEIADDSLDGSGESQTYDIQFGSYTKIGRMVYGEIQINISSLGSLTTTQETKIVGLPFTSRTSTVPGGGSLVTATNLAIAAEATIVFSVPSNVAYIRCFLVDLTTGVSSLLLSEYSADGNLVLYFAYEAA